MDQATKQAERSTLYVGFAVAVAVLLGVLAYRNQKPAVTLNALTLADLAAAQGRWENSRIHDYSYLIVLKGALNTRYQVIVRGGQVIAMTEAGGTPTSRESWSGWTIPALMTSMQQDLETNLNGDMPIPVKGGLFYGAFDPQYGYPTYYFHGAEGAQALEGWEISRFSAEPAAPVTAE